MAKAARKPKNTDRYNAGVPVEIEPFELLDAVGAFGSFLGKRGNALTQMLLSPRTVEAPTKPPPKGKVKQRKFDQTGFPYQYAPPIPVYRQGPGRDAIYASPYGQAIANDEDLAELTPYLLAEEIQQMPEAHHKMAALNRVADFAGQDGQRKYVSPRHDVNLSPEHMYNLALAGSAKKGWYEASYATLQEVFGPDDGARFAALLAATSPQTSVESNLFNTVQIWKNWTAAGRPQTRDEIISIMGASVQGDKGEDSVLEAWRNNSVTALTSPDPNSIQLSGPKVQSFYKNLSGDYDYSTNDTWMGRAFNLLQVAFGGKSSGEESGLPTAGYLSTNAAMRSAANMLTQETGYTWTPANVQEAIWSYVKTLMDYKHSTDAEGMTAKDIVDRNAITGEMIAQTPDFATLFQDPTYAQPLIDAGVLQTNGQLTGKISPDGSFVPLAKRSFGQQDQPPPNREMLGDAAIVFDDIDRAALDTDAVSFPYEVAPYRGAGHLTELLDDDEARAAYTADPRADWIPEGMSQDVLAAGIAPTRLKDNREGVGVWTPEGGPTEFNTVTTPSIVKPVPDKESSKAEKSRLADYDLLSTFRAGMGTQGGVGWNYPVPQRAKSFDPDGAKIYYSKPVMPQQMKALEARYPNVVLHDTGDAITVYPFDRESKEGIETVTRLLADDRSPELDEILGQSTRVRPVIVHQMDEYNRWKEKNPKKRTFPNEGRHAGYAYLEEDWKEPGKGNVTRQILETAGRGSKGFREYIDSGPVRQSVQDFYDLDQEYGDKGMEIRPDIQLMRKRYLEGGLQGLQDALDRGEPLANLSALERFRRAS